MTLKLGVSRISILSLMQELISIRRRTFEEEHADELWTIYIL